jgi:hypothetical protein
VSGQGRGSVYGVASIRFSTATRSDKRQMPGGWATGHLTRLGVQPVPEGVSDMHRRKLRLRIVVVWLFKVKLSLTF